MRLGASILSILLVFLSMPSFGGEKLTLSQLEILFSQKSYEEILEKGQIAPEARNDKWRSIIQRSATEAANAYKEPRLGWSQFAKFMSWTSQYPFIAADESIGAILGASAKHYVQDCFKNNVSVPSCVEFARDIQQGAKLSAEASHDIGIVIAKAVNGDAAALPFFHQSLKTSGRKASCRGEELQSALRDALQFEPGSSEVKMAQELAFGLCFDPSDEEFIKSITEDDKQLRNTCAPLLKKNGLSGVRKKKCERFAKLGGEKN